ncbi:MAG: 2-oxoacid:acceptor oxidoreductase subunit alpha [Candidatus ainarchaeum sp.]|nr:2-oxoacid:acceptor oxidoreductase subunit alpha [Candidatus ainarchaeum sp.]MDD5096571.1 2-oxoacid:acceptor oxidoreductase subunit alpha [Candidatus ainarchaeum sp.]
MEFTWIIGAEAGAGSMVTGRTLAKVFARGGYHVIGYPEYPSLIRGGHNTYQIRVSDREIHSPVKKNDVVVALNRDGIIFHRDFMNKGGVLIYDSEIDAAGIKMPEGVSVFPVPLKQIIEQNGLDPRMANTVTVGMSLGLLGYPMEDFFKLLDKEFSRKSKEIVDLNIRAAKAGFDYVKNNFKGHFAIKFKPMKSDGKKIVIGGNEAFALGAVAGGAKFFSAYPMTPASSVLHYLAEKERDFNIVVKQTEDELAAVEYAIGASYAGVRAATATSGGGFSLMAESLGLSALSETPVVVFLAQRPGPSTCMPTWTEQGDLRFALHASQGEFLRVLLAPGTVDEEFYLGAEAFNFAEKYQIPVIVLSDKFLSESHFSTREFEPGKVKIERGGIEAKPKALKPMERFGRYKLTRSGISPRTFPGTPNGMHVATSYEHREDSFSCENFEMRVDMVDKRARKQKLLEKEIPLPKVYGKKDAHISIICWGSQMLPALDALPILEAKGIHANVIHFSYLYPLPKKIRALLKSAKNTIMIENNSTAQFAGMLKEFLSFRPNVLALKYDGRQFFPDEVADAVEEASKNKFRRKVMRVVDRGEYEYYNPALYAEVK